MKLNRKLSEQQEKDIKEIVDFYMQYVTDFHSEIEECMKYSWDCMSDGTIEDYLEIVRERKAQEK